MQKSESNIYAVTVYDNKKFIEDQIIMRNHDMVKMLKDAYEEKGCTVSIREEDYNGKSLYETEA